LKILQKRDFGGGERNKMGKLLDEWEVHSQPPQSLPCVRFNRAHFDKLTQVN
jgi:hypothetical protein